MDTKIRFFEFSGYRLMILTSATLMDCISQLRQGLCDGFFISEGHGFDLDSIEFLGDLKEIKALQIMHDIKLQSFDGIKKLTNLEYLCLRAKRLPLNLENLINLKDLEIDYLDERFKLPTLFPKLEVILLGHFNPKSKNLECIEFAKKSKKLYVVQSNLESLQGLECFLELNKACFSYVPNLEDIGTLNPPNLKSLEFDCCKKVKNFEEVAKFKGLEILEIVSSGTIPNISFINAMPNLRNFKFVKTNVLDGNLSPCLRLQYAHTLGKRHYSHRPDQLPGFTK